MLSNFAHFCSFYKPRLSLRFLMAKRCVHTSKAARVSTIQYTVDRYNGAHINSDQFQETTSDFEVNIKDLLQQWQDANIRAAWITLPLEKCHLIPTAARYGFKFHHAEGEMATLCQWLDTSRSSALPRFATHQVGVSGCVIRADTNEVLAVKDKNRPFSLWKFPGGISDLGEDVSACAEREVFEETGVKSEFQGVLTFRQQHDHPGTFGRSDMYFVCLMKALSYELNPCEHEIEECSWLKLDVLLEGTSAITQRIVQLLQHGLQSGFGEVVMKSETFKSVYKGQEYKLFSRPLAQGTALKNYVHDVADVKT